MMGVDYHPISTNQEDLKLYDTSKWNGKIVTIDTTSMTSMAEEYSNNYFGYSFEYMISIFILDFVFLVVAVIRIFERNDL